MKIPSGVRIIAAVKNRNDSELEKIHSKGIQDFGENKLQEHLNRSEKIKSKNINWHFIGRIQMNKIKKISKEFKFIHSISRFSEIKQISKLGPPYPTCLIQINLGDSSKSGINPTDLKPLLDVSRKENPELPIKGLMTMPPYTTNPEENRMWFREVKKLGEENFKKPLLSMGTTQDWKVAISEGSNIIRLGRKIFEF
tara:strand:- start:1980 stop:2570 length:591 start_codon:yes stop_codon:yes gene_type:complete